MTKIDVEKRKQELINYINTNHKLPLNWKEHFEDGGDMRLWFDSIYHLDKFKDYNQELNELFNKYNIHVLTSLEKEQEFREYVSRRRQIPRVHEYTFSDNSDMAIWYLTYKDEHEEFETSIQENLPEYQELDLAEIWSDCKDEFLDIIKSQGRIPRYGEFKINDRGIDVRTIFDKLVSFDPDFSERLLLHLETFHNPHCLSKEDRYLEYKVAVTTLGYEPDIQELRFSDGTDMFTWITKYRTEEFQKEIDSITNPKPEREVNIYYIPKFRKTGGKFYTICTNYGERLDLAGINSFEEAKKLDPTIKKSGGLILKKTDIIKNHNPGGDK